jgi:hypothetical protein
VAVVAVAVEAAGVAGAGWLRRALVRAGSPGFVLPGRHQALLERRQIVVKARRLLAVEPQSSVVPPAASGDRNSSTARLAARQYKRESPMNK